MKVRWVLIGCGKVVLKNKETPFLNENNEIVGIVTTNKKTAENAINQLGLNIKTYDNYKEMLDNVECDAIYICTPPKFHYEYLKKVAKYNKLVLVEKPFVLNYKEAEEIKNLYINNVYGLLYKSSTDKIITLKNIIDNNIYGDVLEVQCNFKRIFKKEYLNSWIYNKDISGGGRVFDIIEHVLDVLYFLFGDFSNINSKVIRDSKYHDCESKIYTDLFCGQTKIKMNFDMECNEYEDDIFIFTNKYAIKFSINNYDDIYIYEDNKLVKKISTNSEKIWGKELIDKLYKVIKENNYTHYLPDLNILLKIQKCVDEIIN